MDYKVKTELAETLHSDCLVIPVFENKKVYTMDHLDAIKTLIKSGDMTGKTGQTVILHQPAGTSCDRIILLGCGKMKDLQPSGFKKLIKCAWKAIENTAAKSAHWDLFSIKVNAMDDAWKVRVAIETIEDCLYHYTETKSEPEPTHVTCSKIVFMTEDNKQVSTLNTAIAQGQAIAAGVKLAKSLSNLPGNICTPRYLASQAKKLAKNDETLTTKILSEAKMDKLGMGSLLSVSKGSREPAKLIIMQYHGAGSSEQPIIFVGKGLTFDAGGISIKSSAAMDEMKYDMCGGASVFGAILACKQLKLPLNVYGVVPSSENLPDGAANKPGDIVTSLSGQTIEILNTDAEGRLILCDALTYSERFNPKIVIDVATLTGACIVALGDQASGLMSNDQTLADSLLNAGEKSGDRCWQLPIWEDYQEQLKSNFADMANIGGKGAGSITAACFLSRFTKQLKWAHLDIAGTAWRSGKEKGATGRPVALLTQFLLDQVHDT